MELFVWYAFLFCAILVIIELRHTVKKLSDNLQTQITDLKRELEEMKEREQFSQHHE